MKKILNFRPLFYCFIAFFSAILFAQYLFKTNWIYITLFIIILFGLLILSILRKKIKIYLCVLIFFFIGLLGYCVEASTFNVKSYTGDLNISGRVVSNKLENSVQKVILDNVSIDNEEIKENIYVYVYGFPYLNVGDNIEFESEIEKSSAFYNESFSSFNYKNNIRYNTRINGSEIEILGSNRHINETIRLSVKEKLIQNMTPDHAALAYAMLFGDTSEVDISTMDDYRGSGILHILSVSGLHVGIIIGFLYWFFRKIRCPNLVSFLIIIGILVFYCYLCGFVPTVVRASIMSICLLGSALIGKKYDALSAVGLAGLLILLIKPLYAYDIGFQLSFGCMIGISMLYSPLNYYFRKVKIPKFISSSLAISISAQLFILPVLINAFGGSSIFSVFLNVLIVPVFSVAYIIIFLSTPLLFISGFFGNFLWFSSLLMQGINICANFVASLTWSIIPKIELTFALMIGFYSMLFILSRYVFLKFKAKLIICSSIILVCLTFIIVKII
jgi:competence protein ComEC